MTQLRRLDISLSLGCSGEVLSASLNKTYSLQELRITDLIFQSNEMDALRKITSPPPLLQYLRISGLMDGMPEWFGSLAHLVMMDMSWTELNSEEILGILCKLPNLLDLILGSMSYSNDSLVARAKYRFPVLKHLTVSSGVEIHNNVTFEQGSMAMLEKLDVYSTDWVTTLSGIEHLPSLEEVLLVGKRSNDSISQTVVQLKSESEGRPVPNQFKVLETYEEEFQPSHA